MGTGSRRRPMRGVRGQRERRRLIPSLCLTPPAFAAKATVPAVALGAGFFPRVCLAGSSRRTSTALPLSSQDAPGGTSPRHAEALACSDKAAGRRLTVGHRCGTTVPA